MILYATNKYGDENNNSESVFQTMQIKKTFKNVGRAFGIDYNTLNNLAGSILRTSTKRHPAAWRSKRGIQTSTDSFWDGPHRAKERLSQGTLRASSSLGFQHDPCSGGLLPIQWDPVLESVRFG